MSEDPAKATTLKALVVAAHVDDDGVGFGIGLRERRDVAVVYLTDSAPCDPRFFVTAAPSRAAYKDQRRAEAVAAARLVGIPERSLFFLDAPDMESYRELARLEDELHGVAASVGPQVLWSPAYDGGHPDHDVAAFLTARLAARLNVWHGEFALYSYRRRIEQFRFASGGDGTQRQLNRTEQEFKRELLNVYTSQAPLLAQVNCDRERYRPAHRHDFTQRPSERTLYEAWDWPVNADMLVDAFRVLTTTD